MAKACGVHTIRIATHCTEADISKQQHETARNMGFDVVGFPMMAHQTSTEKLVEQAKLMESYGAHCVYVVDSAGALLMSDTQERIAAFKANLGVEVGYHNHNTWAWGLQIRLLP